MPSISPLIAAAALCLTLPGALAAPIQLQSVEATFQSGTPADLQNTIDGIEVQPTGWSVTPHVSEKQAAIFRSATPLDADTFNLTMCFLSGRPFNSIAEFALSASTDPTPTPGGNWEPFTIIGFSATNATLKRTPDNHLRSVEVPSSLITGTTRDATYSITVRTSLRGITGFRLEAFPVQRSSGKMVMSWGLGDDFILTEFRAEVAASATNIALGALATSSHPLARSMTPGALTDGLPSTFVLPREPTLGTAFFYEIDLGSVHDLDHLALRQRNDDHDFNRLSRVVVQLYESAPADGATPLWKGIDRADDTFPKAGESDILRAAAGHGIFRGRYLRISSESHVPYSPQLAEVEVYETRTLRLVSLRADERKLALTPVVVPPRSRRLRLELNIPQRGLPPNQVFRWRLRGYGDDWRPARDLLLDIPCPPPGGYAFEAQAAHSDGTWDASLLDFPLSVRAPFTETGSFRWLAACGTLALGALTMRHFARRRIAALEAASALSAERTRIARDMHDEVGARLAQLAILQDTFARDYPLPDGARADLAQLATTARQAVAALDAVVWTVNPQNDTLASLADYLAQAASDYLAPLRISCRIDTPMDWPEVEIGAQVRHSLALAFKEALQNIVKHAHATEVYLTLRHESGQFIVSLADNGRGLPLQASGLGKDGLSNMSSRLSAMGGSCEVRQRQSTGTEVEMRIPLAR